MARSVDPEVLAGFVSEARGYLPAILGGLESYRRQPGSPQPLEEVHRLVHSIKGASSLLGLSALSKAAHVVEEVVEDLASGKLSFDQTAVTTLADVVSSIDAYLDMMPATGTDVSLLGGVERSLRRLRGWPEPLEGDVATGATEPPPATPPPLPAFRAPALHEASEEIVEGFLVEAEEHLMAVARNLVELERSPARKDLLQAVRRSVHTLKGAAAVVGFETVARLSHRMEDLLDALYEDHLGLDAPMSALLAETTDVLEDLVASRQSQGIEAAEALRRRYEPYVPEPEASPARSLPLGLEPPLDLPGLPVPSGDGEPRREVAPVSAGDLVRVPISRLDELVRLVSELVINRAGLEQHFGRLGLELEELHPGIQRLKRAASRLETQYEVAALAAASESGRAPAGFDELEFDRYTEFHVLSREMTETTSDISSVGNEITDVAGDFESALLRQARLTSELQDKLLRLRMVPVGTMSTRLLRAARVTASQQGKLVELALRGEETLLDKAVLEQVADPLLHLVRNAVDHGIEPPALRRALGKPAEGRVLIRATAEATEVVIEVSDDGAGLEVHALRAAAAKGRWVPEGEAATLSEEALFQLVFQPGFSTAGEVTEISGRGVGMDVVKTAVGRMKGTVAVRSTPGAGVTVTIRLPMTLAVARALLVRAGDQTAAVPLRAVTQILLRRRSEIGKSGNAAVLILDGRILPLRSLSSLLGLPASAEDDRPLPVLVVEAGGQRVAWVVDELLGQREVVVKPLGSHLRRVKGIAGATLMGDGSVVLILNPAELGGEAEAGALHPAPERARVSGAASRPRAASEVLIVDDSASVRRVVSNLVKSAGFAAVTARDGVEALELLQRSGRLPDAILLDIEMPRMDGYELTSVLRSQESTRSLPIVILTSRAGEKHRRKAFELGATEYVVKPYQDGALVDLLRRLTREPGPVQ